MIRWTMSRLDEIRGQLIPATPHVIDTIPVQEEIQVGEVVEETWDDDAGWGPDEEVFDEALDMMETSYKMLGALLLRIKMSPGTRQLIENHRCDLKLFVDEWQVVP